MLIQAHFREPIARGEMTLTFRRWKRCQVVAGHTYRTAAGRIVVDAVEEVDPLHVSDADATRAGFASRTELLAALRGDPACRPTASACMRPTGPILARIWRCPRR